MFLRRTLLVELEESNPTSDRYCDDRMAEGARGCDLRAHYGGCRRCGPQFALKMVLEDLPKLSHGLPGICRQYLTNASGELTLKSLTQAQWARDPHKGPTVDDLDVARNWLRDRAVAKGAKGSSAIGS